MVQIVGKYQHERNENIDEYFKATGVPYVPRKMMSVSHPSMEIFQEEGTWTIKIASLLRTVELKFKPGEEYEEHMPGGIVIKSVTVLDGDKLKTESTGPDGSKTLRDYEFTEDGCVITMTHEPTGKSGKRYFKRV